MVREWLKGKREGEDEGERSARSWLVETLEVDL